MDAFLVLLIVSTAVFITFRYLYTLFFRKKNNAGLCNGCGGSCGEDKD